MDSTEDNKDQNADQHASPTIDEGDGSTDSRPPWDGGRAILYFILAAFSSIVVAVVLLGPLGFNGSVIASEVLVFGAIPMALSVVFATGWRTWMAKPAAPPQFWLWALGAVLSFVVAQSNLLVFIDRLYPIPNSQLQLFRQYLTADSPSGLFGMIVVAAVVPGIFEEIAFRGLIQSGLRLSYGPRHAIVWTGLFFALLHMNPWNFISLWSLGCFLGYVTERTGSIRPAIVLHLVNNACALILLFVQGKDQWTTRPEFIPWYWTVLAGGVMVFALWKVHRLTEGPGQPVTEEHRERPGPPVGGTTFPLG